MNRRFSSLLAVVLGVLAIRLTITGEYLNYVRRGMFVWLLLSGAVLIVLGAVGWKAANAANQEHDDGCSHGHHHPLSRAVWLLIFPVLAVGLTQPAPLGSFAANRQTAKAPRQSSDVAALVQKVADQKVPETVGVVAQPAVEPSPLAPEPEVAATAVAGIPVPSPAPGEIAEMSFLDFLEITYYDDTNALAGVPVRLVGFVMPAAGGDGTFLLSRFMINCCAADATLLQTAITGARGPLPQQDTWVAVTGKWHPGEPTDRFSPDGFPVPELVADKVEVVPVPPDPYLSLAVD